MMQENSLSADQVAAVLEDASVSAVDVWALLYANQQARELRLPKPASREQSALAQGWSYIHSALGNR